jgi:serine/threonine-protein kinase
MVPFHRARGVLVGFLVLGPRRSEQPYFASDRKLLEALAAQIAFVNENLSLRTQVDWQSKAVRDLRVQLAESDPGMVRECPTCGRCFAAVGDCCPVDQSSLIVTSLVPLVIADHYGLERVLGRGGSGTVYEAADLVLKRRVAVKVQSPDKLRPETLRRFQREAYAVASLSHANIVGAYDFGLAESGAAYFVMELVRGRTLRVRMNEGEATAERAAEWFAQILDGIQAAHQGGIIHRDLKPENILITDAADTGNSMVKITDFGLARLNRPEASDTGQLTLAGEVFGTIPYMAPEQLRGESTSTASDLFAIGVMAFEVLTGSVPFGVTYHARLLALREKPVLLPATTPEQLRLREVLLKCIEHDPGDRFPSAAALKQELIPLMARYGPTPGRLAARV